MVNLDLFQGYLGIMNLEFKNIKKNLAILIAIVHGQGIIASLTLTILNIVEFCEHVQYVYYRIFTSMYFNNAL